MKSNDTIPEDELLLAEAIAAAKVSRRGFGELHPFTDRHGNKTTADKCDNVCVLGALHFAGVLSMTNRRLSPLPDLAEAPEANDNDATVKWRKTKRDRGASLGYAFRCYFKD